MLKITTLDHTGRLTDTRISEAVKANAAVLDQLKEETSLPSDSIGWLDPEKWAGEEQLSRFEEIAAQVKKNSEAFVVIGVGGSNNAARSVIKALAPESPSGVEILWAGNTLSPSALSRTLRALDGKDFSIDCIAKNFETLEPGASFRVFRQELARRYGKNASDRIIATGTIGSELEKLCTDNGCTFLPFPTDIGGRYTAMSSVGLLPMAVAGLDIRALVRGAEKMRHQLYTLPTEENPALIYASIRNLLYRDGYRMEMLSSFEPELRWFYKWWIQLFAESEGKEGKGLFPVASEYSEELHSVGQFVQEGTPLLFESFLEIEQPMESLLLYPDSMNDHFDYLNGKDFSEVNRASFTATRKAHAERLPTLTLRVPKLDMETFGELFYFYQFACVLSGLILGVNPFDQPGVEAYKQLMFRTLGKQ